LALSVGGESRRLLMMMMQMPWVLAVLAVVLIALLGAVLTAVRVLAAHGEKHRDL
jgi:hypothetical protein